MLFVSTWLPVSCIICIRKLRHNSFFVPVRSINALLIFVFQFWTDRYRRAKAAAYSWKAAGVPLLMTVFGGYFVQGDSFLKRKVRFVILRMVQLFLGPYVRILFIGWSVFFMEKRKNKIKSTSYKKLFPETGRSGKSARSIQMAELSKKWAENYIIFSLFVEADKLKIGYWYNVMTFAAHQDLRRRLLNDLWVRAHRRCHLDS